MKRMPAQSMRLNKLGGVSLIELLIAMTLGLILLAGMIAVFSGNKRSSELNTAMANIQENARFALSALGNDIRMAGFQGCLDSRRGRMTVKANDAPVPTDGVYPDGSTKHNPNLSAATGSVIQPSGAWVPAIAGGFTASDKFPPVPGTHALAVQYGKSRQSRLQGPVNSGAAPDLQGPAITVDDLELAIGDLALIGNCESVDLFTVTNAEPENGGQKLSHAATKNADGNFTTRYGIPRNKAQTYVMGFESRVYYVGDTGLENGSGDEIRALYMQSYPYDDPDNNPPAEIVQGVENLRIAYGISTNNTLRYVTADDAAFRAEDVESIQIGLIMSSWDRIAEQEDKNTYVIAGQSILPSASSIDGQTHPQDGRYRLIFNTTIKVRNRRDERISFN